MALRRRIDLWLGLLRSLIIYWRPGRQKALRALYAPFVRPGDLVFDVGAHLGDRTAAFRALGARVVAVEPQPAVRRWLERLVGRDAGVTVRAEAVGSEPGTARLAVSRRTPTVSTLVEDWSAALPGADHPVKGVRWEERVEVPLTTLDALITAHGAPAFCKLDVEGFEAEALAGLTRALPALSFEFVSGALPVAVACVRRLEVLGAYEFNAIPGEARRFVSEGWWAADDAVAWLEAGAGGATSGDVYARTLSLPDPAGGDHG